MSYFNFLSPDLDEVPDDEATNAENQAFEESHKAAKKNPVRFNLDAETTSEAHDFQKERAKLGDFAKQQALEAVQKLADKRALSTRQMGAAGGTSGQPADFSELQQKINASTPDQYANIVLSEAQKHVQGADIEDVLKPLEEAVTNYKRLTVQQQPQMVGQIQSQLASQDQPAKEARAKVIDSEIEKANKDLQIAATTRQAKQIKDNIRFLSEQRQRLGLQQQIQQAQEPTPEQVAGPTPVTTYLGALGVPKEKVVESVQKTMEASGIPPEQWDDPVPTHAGMLRVMSAMDKDGTLAQAMAADLDKAKQQDAEAKGYEAEAKNAEGEKLVLEGKVGQHEARMRQLYAQLNEQPFMHTWPGIILYVLTGMLVGPGIATKLFANLDTRRAIGNELNSIKFDIRRLDHQIDQKDQQANFARRQAILRMTHKDDKAEAYKQDLQKMFIQHQLILQRDSQRHPERASANKALGDAFSRERNFLQQAQHTKDEAQRILSNDFSDEKDKQKARVDMTNAERDVQFYKRRLLWIDGKIKELGGVNMPDENAESDGQ